MGKYTDDEISNAKNHGQDCRRLHMYLSHDGDLGHEKQCDSNRFRHQKGGLIQRELELQHHSGAVNRL